MTNELRSPGGGSSDKMTDANITKVTHERWAQAQSWERENQIALERFRARGARNQIWRVLSWLGLKPRHRGDDSNNWWYEKFEHYSFLPPHMDSAIELGCGPFTNMRLILKACTPAHVVLSDPLIRTYVNFPLAFVADMYQRAACMLDDHPIEDCPYASDYFDLVVMTNVLDHVQDADACLRQAVRITKPGGFLIIGQELSDQKDAEIIQKDPGVIGHPILVDHLWLDGHLAAFTPVLKKVLPRAEGRGPAYHYGTYLFAGQKASTSA